MKKKWVLFLWKKSDPDKSQRSNKKYFNIFPLNFSSSFLWFYCFIEFHYFFSLESRLGWLSLLDTCCASWILLCVIFYLGKFWIFQTRQLRGAQQTFKLRFKISKDSLKLKRHDILTVAKALSTWQLFYKITGIKTLSLESTKSLICGTTKTVIFGKNSITVIYQTLISFRGVHPLLALLPYLVEKIRQIISWGI